MSIVTEIQRLQEAKADIKTAIEEKGVEVGNGLIDGYADKVDAVYDKGVSDGKKSQYDEFWDAYQTVLNNGKREERHEYVYSFSGNAWTDEIFNPKNEIIVYYGQGTNLFRGNGSITNTKVPIRFKYVTTNHSTYVFNACPKLQTIVLLEVGENQKYTGWFVGCLNLTDITFAEGSVIGQDINFKDCPLLNKESITSIITHLSDTQGATLTLKQEAINREFPGEGEWETFLAENKPSVWSIYLV